MLGEECHWLNSEKEKSCHLTADILVHKVNAITLLIWRRNVWVEWPQNCLQQSFWEQSGKTLDGQRRRKGEWGAVENVANVI